MAPIVLLTDFGPGSSYVGTLKGVLQNIAPTTTIVDLAHDLPPFDIFQGALNLFQSYSYFPEKSIFVVVVDPGVGSDRKPLLVQTEHYYFIGPDNGVFTFVLEKETVKHVIHLDEERFWLHPVSDTFHGRDIFGPVAAHLSLGTHPGELGTPIETYHTLKDLHPHVEPTRIVGKVLTLDRFGNAITNLRRDFLKDHFPQLEFDLEIPNRLNGTLQGIKTHYAAGKPGEALYLFGSSGFLEISVSHGSAAQKLGLNKGDVVLLPL